MRRRWMHGGSLLIRIGLRVAVLPSRSLAVAVLLLAGDAFFSAGDSTFHGAAGVGVQLAWDSAGEIGHAPGFDGGLHGDGHS